MSLVALCPIAPDDTPEKLYFADDTGRIFVLDFYRENAVLIDGAYTPRFIGESQQVTKHGMRFVVEGVGQEATATLTVSMDDGRTFTQALSGPYSVEGPREILFYTEFEPSLITGRVFLCEVGNMRGVGVEIGNSRLEYVPIDGR